MPRQKKTEVVEETTQTPEAEAPANPQLQIGDIAGAVSVIDICTKRGAFEGTELEAVGALRNRLATFVQATQPAQEEGEEASAEETEEA